MSGRYDDIINLPHHTSATRPRMPVRDRAAQFAPFTALTGYDDAIDETGRITDSKAELGEAQLDELDFKLLALYGRIAERPEIQITYFKADDKKDGGAYLLYEGRLKKIDRHSRRLVFEDGSFIPIDDIFSIENLS